MLGFLRRVVVEEEGQDLVEYALLAALVALASAAAILAVQTRMQTTYVSWNTATQTCWQMPAPGEPCHVPAVCVAGGGC